MRIVGVAAALLLLGPAGGATAGPAAVVLAGTSRGGDAQLLPRAEPASCGACFAGGPSPPATSGGGQLATLGVGLVGTEGRARGGAELFTILGMTEHTTDGFTGVVTYAGLDQGRVFAQGGLGLGSYWGHGRAGTLDALAGDARGELGLRLHPQWLVVGRADFLLNSISGAAVGTLALQFIP
jgi:hypothetical protein